MLPENLLFSSNLSGDLNAFFKENSFSQIAVLVDENTRKKCLPLIENSLPKFEVIQIQSGESNKTLTTCEIIWGSLSEKHFDRKSLLINLGGGVICDIGGFVASTYKRGIAFLNIPTSLLAQADASIGGKTGIDFQGFKNQIGTFNDALGIIIHTLFLKTLPDREIKAGFAEIIKHGLIADKNFFEKLGNIILSDYSWDESIMNSIRIKHNIVSQDRFEAGIRKALNFGHTIGHAIESYFLNTHTPLLHGEAIAIGMVCEAFLSKEQAGLKEEELQHIVSVISRFFEKRMIPEEGVETLLELLGQDKKNENGEIRVTLIPEIGKALVNQVMSLEEAKRSISYFNALSWNS